MTKPKPARRISIRSVRKDPIDYKKLGRALIALAMAQAEAEAQAQAETPDARNRKEAEEAAPRPEDTE